MSKGQDRVYITLLRGINVGGRNKLPMVELREILAKVGAHDVATYIQSGNAVFRHPETTPEVLALLVGQSIEEAKGFLPQVFVFEREDLEQALKNNPFPHAVQDPKTLHLLFLSRKPENPRLDALKKLRNPTEDFHLTDRVFYLYAPYGIGRSRLAAQAEPALGVDTTGRNWRSVSKILDLAREFTRD
jgi:uncharacterized protein (DUF1697 family)